MWNKTHLITHVEGLLGRLQVLPIFFFSTTSSSSCSPSAPAITTAMADMLATKQLLSVRIPNNFSSKSRRWSSASCFVILCRSTEEEFVGSDSDLVTGGWGFEVLEQGLDAIVGPARVRHVVCDTCYVLSRDLATRHRLVSESLVGWHDEKCLHGNKLNSIESRERIIC